MRHRCIDLLWPSHIPPRVCFTWMQMTSSLPVELTFAYTERSEDFAHLGLFANLGSSWSTLSRRHSQRLWISLAYHRKHLKHDRVHDLHAYLHCWLVLNVYNKIRLAFCEVSRITRSVSIPLSRFTWQATIHEIRLWSCFSQCSTVPIYISLGSMDDVNMLSQRWLSKSQEEDCERRKEAEAEESQLEQSSTISRPY